MEWAIIVVLAIVTVWMYFSYRSKSSSLETMTTDFYNLSRRKEEEVLRRYAAEATVESQQERMKKVLATVDTVLCIDTSQWHDSIASDTKLNHALTRWHESVINRIREYKAEIAAGNRRELEDKLYEFWGAVGFEDYTFEAFMHEFLMLPEATLNRIIVKISRS